MACPYNPPSTLTTIFKPVAAWPASRPRKTLSRAPDLRRPLTCRSAALDRACLTPATTAPKVVPPFMTKKNLHPILFAFFAFLLLFHAMLFWRAKDNALNGGADFSSFYAAVKMIHEGQGSHLYNIAAQGHYQSSLFPNVATRSGTLLFLHPPFEALPYIPLAYLSYPAAYFVCLIMNVLLLLVTVAVLSPYMAELKALWKPFPMLLLLGFFPVFIDLLQGQDSIWLLLAFALAFDSLKKRNSLRGGIFLGLGLFKFQYALPFLVPFVLWRRWKVVGGFAITGVLLLLLSLPVTGIQGMLSYVSFLFGLTRVLASQRIQSVVGILSNTMPNIHGIVEMVIPNLFHSVLQKIIVVLLSGLAVLWATVRWPLNRTLSETHFDLGYSLALVMSILVSYHLLLHDLSLLLIPFVLVLDHMLKGEVCAGRQRLLMYGLITLFFLSPLYLLLIKLQRMYLFFWPILIFGIMLSREIVLAGKGRQKYSNGNPSGSLTHAT